MRRKDCVAFPPALEEAIKISSREIERIKGTSQVKDAIAKPHDFIGNFLIKELQAIRRWQRQDRIGSVETNLSSFIGLNSGVS